MLFQRCLVSNIDFKMKMITIIDVYFPMVGDRNYRKKIGSDSISISKKLLII